MRKEEKPVLFLFSLMQRYAFCAVLPKRAKLCRRLAKRRAALEMPIGVERANKQRPSRNICINRLSSARPNGRRDRKFLIVRFSFENVRKNAAWFYGNSENRPIIHLSEGRIIKFLPF